jgi:outer membrane protein
LLTNRNDYSHGVFHLTRKKLKNTQMKKIIILAAIIFAMGLSISAQKYAYVNTDYILDNVPEYADAQAQLDELSVQWQKEIEVKFAEIDKMY